uniref:DUF6286 domain-containing protein n=1 Tax=Aquipuribacter hungaricus TaxID=545624 RepID=UPI0030EBB139
LGLRLAPAPASEVLPPAAAPAGVPAAAVLATLLCLALVALGLLALREVTAGREVGGQVVVPGEPWAAPLLASATEVVPGTTAVAAGAAGLVVGLLLLLVALRPRPARTVRLVDPAGRGVPLDLDPGSVARLAADTALGEDEVLSSRGRADRRRVAVHVTVDPRDAHDVRSLTASTAQRVAARLEGLQPAPRVGVHVHGARS